MSSLESLLTHRRAKKAARFRGTIDHNLTDNSLNQQVSNTNASTNDIPSNVTHNDSSSTVTRKRSRRKTKPANIHLDHSSVINLSSCSLSTDEISILSRGLTFCPTPRHINWPEVSADIYDFSRRMRLAEYFFDENSNTHTANEHDTPFHNKSTWNPPNDRERALNTFLDAVKLDITTAKPKPTQDNLTATERQAISQLKQRQDIIIKPADKGSGTVVMDKTWYIDECNRQLTDTKFYQRLDEDITADIQKRVTFYVNGMHKDKLINDKTKQYLIQSDVKPGRFYILPKIHKPGNPGRPIVSSNSHPTERLSHFVDYHLQPLVHKLPSFVKDTNDFLNKLLTIGNLPANSLLVTLDVSSLYTNIPHKEGINACEHFLRTSSHKTIPTSTLCDLIRMILTMNNFSFNDNHYLQIHGTAMGTKMAPSYANLFLGLFEANALKNAPFQPHTWLRYIDDIFMIWTEGPDNLKIFIDYLNNIHSTIKFTSSHSSTNIPFLDVSVSLTNDGSISTDLYTKPTDKHQHLLYSSCHPSHTKKAIPFSLALRLRRICSTDATFHTRTAQLTTYLLKRGYNRNFVNKQIRRAADIPRQLTLQTKDVNKPKRIPFITIFNPSLPHISHIIKKHFNLLLSSHRCKSVFQHPPVVAFRRSPNLRDLLVTAKLPFNSTHPQLPSGSFRCGKNCATCPYICHGLTTYTFFSTGETRPIKSNLTCETKNLIYMIQCNRCNLQYIGETKRRLKDRFNEHRRTVDNPNNKSKPTTAAEHFLSSPNHTANDMLLIPIEKIFSKRDSIRKAREAFLIQKGKTIDPDGLNIREETY